MYSPPAYAQLSHEIGYCERLHLPVYDTNMTEFVSLSALDLDFFALNFILKY
jgi:hypothetical protein